MYLLDDTMPPMTKNRLWSEILMGEERPESMGGLILTLVLLLHGGVLYFINSSTPEPIVKPEKIMEVTLVAVPLPVADVPPPLPKIEPPKPIVPPKPLPPPPKPIVKPKPVVKPKPALKKSEIAKPAPTPEAKPIIEPTPYVPPAPVAKPAPAKAAPAVSKPQPAKETQAQADYGYNPKPKYPSVARSRGWTGKVILQVRVSADGEAEQVTVAQSSGHDILDDAAVSAVEGWRFKPAKRGDTAVSSTVRVPINFQLDN